MVAPGVPGLIREFLKREGQFLLPMLELVEQTEVAIDEVIQVMGRATIEAVLEMSAEAHERKTTRCGMAGRVVWFTCVRVARSRCRQTQRCGAGRRGVSRSRG